MKSRKLIVAAICTFITLLNTGCFNTTISRKDPTSQAVNYIEQLSGKDCELVSKELCTRTDGWANKINWEEKYWKCYVAVKDDPFFTYYVEVDSNSVHSDYKLDMTRYNIWRQHLKFERQIENMLNQYGIRAKCHFTLGSEALSAYGYAGYNKNDDTMLDFVKRSESIIKDRMGWYVANDECFLWGYEPSNGNERKLREYSMSDIYASKFVALQLDVDMNCGDTYTITENIKRFLNDYSTSVLNNEYYAFVSCIHLVDSNKLDELINYTPSKVSELTQLDNCNWNYAELRHSIESHRYKDGIDLDKLYVDIYPSSSDDPNEKYTKTYFLNYVASQCCSDKNTDLQNNMLKLTEEISNNWANRYSIEIADYMNEVRRWNEKYYFST